MQNTNSPWDTPPQPRRHWFAWLQYKPYQLVIAASVFLTACLLFSQMYSINRSLPILYVAEPANSLAQQSAYFLSEPMTQNNIQDIENTVQTIAQSEHVLNVSVYSVDGRKLASSDATWESISYLKEHTEPAQTLMIPITSESDKPLGMLQLNVDTKPRREKLQPLLSMQNIFTTSLFLLSFLGGGLGVLAFIRYRPSWPYVKQAFHESIHRRR